MSVLQTSRESPYDKRWKSRPGVEEAADQGSAAAGSETRCKEEVEARDAVAGFSSVFDLVLLLSGLRDWRPALPGRISPLSPHLTMGEIVSKFSFKQAGDSPLSFVYRYIAL